MPNPKTAYKRVRSGCTKGCSLNPENLPMGVGELVHKWFEEGCNNAEIIEKAGIMGAKLSNGSVGRHRKDHLHRAAPEGAAVPGAEGRKLTELELLDAMIQQGGAQMALGQQKVTAEQTLRAIELKMKLTEGSVFDAMFAAMAGELEDDLGDLEEPEGDAPAPEPSSDGPREGR